MRPWACSTPLNTAGFGSAKQRLRHGQQRLGVGAALVDLAREPALDHRDEPLGAHVRRWRRWRRRRPCSTSGNRNVSVAAEHREPVDGA